MQIFLHKDQSMDLFKVVTPFMFFFILFGFVTGDVAVNCGSDGNSVAFDGRQWVGDASGSEIPALLKGKSKSTIAADKSFSADPVPYRTCRISASPFQYEFRVTAGQKFIRLHFYPAYYLGFRNSEDMFTVKAGPFTLLSDFSASFAAQTLGVHVLVKEFCLNIEQSSVLTISFSPSRRSSASRKAVAFVNGIEVVSMPTSLYYTKDGDLGARNVGLRKGFTFIDDSTALELVERLNTGGTTVLSVEDFGLFRRWNGDSNYLMETGVYQVFYPASIHADAAPSKVYQTSWQMEPNARAQGLNVFRWKISVDVGFGYLVRLHFCHFGAGVADGETERKEFTVRMNDQIAETEADLISFSGHDGIPSYRDYVVLMKGVKEVGKCNLLIVLRSNDERVVGLLSGLEIFKLSNLDNNLAAPNLVLLRTASSPTSWKEKIHKLFTLSKFNVIATGITLLIVLVNVTAHYLRQSWEESITEEKDTMWHSIDPSFCRFSLHEIHLATQNFSDAALIGRGGFGMVYKGLLNRISQVAAIKRLKAGSKQGAREFWSEVEALSKFRHTHLVSLIGYCNEGPEMILVYEYMPRGTLADNIYRLARDRKDNVLLSWEDRLKICIGAARGLEYLHTGTEQGVIHRDVKDTNILLDENFVAKVSDFGLSKFEEFSESKSYMSTKVKGTPGYLDPEYRMTGKLTRMVDVYAFGVVLLVVLSGRPVVDVRNTEEMQSLLSCFMDCIAERDFTVIVDPGLRESIVPSSLKEFVKSAVGCLHHQPKRRPTMDQVAASLELSLEKQGRTILSLSEVDGESSQLNEDGSMESDQLSHTPSPEVKTQLRDDSSPERRPIWGWSWITALSKGKAKKKTDSVSPNKCTPSLNSDIKKESSSSTVSGPSLNSAIKKESSFSTVSGSGPSFSFSDIEHATNRFEQYPISADECDHRKPSYYSKGSNAWLGYVEQLGPVTIYLDRYLDIGASSEFRKEIEKLSKLRHVNLLSLIGYAFNVPTDQSFIVYEHIGFKSLHDCIYHSEAKSTPLSWKLRLSICIGVAEGLAYLQKCTGKAKNHDNLRLANILLDPNCIPKISHFGLSGFSYLAKDTPQNLRQSILPGIEIWEDSDLCSFGLILIEVLFQRRINLEEFAGFLVETRQGIKSRTFHETIDSTLKGETTSTSLVEYLKVLFSCIIAIRLPISMVSVVSSLKAALQLQEQAEGKQADAFGLVRIYQDISDLDVFLDNFEFIL